MRQIPYDNNEFTPKENFKLLLAGEKPCWLPMNCDILGLDAAILPDNVARGFVHEAMAFDPDQDGGGPDMFGVLWEWDPAARGSMVRPGSPKVLELDCWEEYVALPDVDSWDWEGAAERNRASIEQTERMRGSTILNGLFERLVSFADMGGALMSLVDEEEKEGVHRLFSYLVELYGRMVRNLKKYFHIDILTFHDDWGSQRAPMFSLDTCREMLVPYLRRIVDAAHGLGIVFEFHSCGKNELLVPAMIEAGVDMWNGQPINDKRMLCSQYGDQMIFGAAPVGLTAESGPKEVKAAYGQFFEKFQGCRIYGGLVRDVPDCARICYEQSRLAYGAAEI